MSRAGLDRESVLAASYPSPLEIRKDYISTAFTMETTRKAYTYTLEPVTMTTRAVRSGQSTGGSVANCEQRNPYMVNFMVGDLAGGDE